MAFGSLLGFRQQPGGGGLDFTPPLDEFSTAVDGAYGMRLLDSDYTGDCLRVRRSSDASEQDIGFDSGGNLDLSALTAFVGANSATVVTWYDQSGNTRDATASEPINQPRLVNAGTIDTRGTNGFPSIYFDGNAKRFSVTYSSIVRRSVLIAYNDASTSSWTNPISSGYNGGAGGSCYHGHSDATQTFNISNTSR
jgi:hypothetical protein